MLGRYALYDKIASGGMASVHIARLLGPVGFARTVAIKRMHPQFAEDPEFVSMFLDEARVAARIRHPNVVPTLDVVSMAGELFLVMDYVHGESLSRLIRVASARKERLPPAMVATIMVGVLHGLHAAHEAKSDRGEALEIVHRDVSPHNVLVGTDGTARVLDFGVAKAMGRVQTTREGQLKGKLAYMAPEQARGTVTRKTDIYACAVVLWEALTSKRLFTGDNEAQVLTAVLTGCNVPPSRYAPDVSPELDALTLRGLSVDPAKRFATARDMARALEETMALVPASQIGEWVESAAHETLDERSSRIAAIENDSAVRSQPHGLEGLLSGESSPSAVRMGAYQEGGDSAVRSPGIVRRPDSMTPGSGTYGPAHMPSQRSMVPVVAPTDGIPIDVGDVGDLAEPAYEQQGSPAAMSLSSTLTSGRAALLAPTPPTAPLAPPDFRPRWRTPFIAGAAVVVLALAVAIWAHEASTSGPQGLPGAPSAGAAGYVPPEGTLPPSPTASASPSPSGSAGPGPAPAPATVAASALPQAAGVPAAGGQAAAPPRPPPQAPRWTAAPAAPAAAPRPANPAPNPGQPAAPPPKASQCDPPWVLDSRGVRVFKQECL